MSGRYKGSPQESTQHSPLWGGGALAWSEQKPTLQLSALAKNGEGMEDLRWLFPNIALLEAILSLGGQREFYQLGNSVGPGAEQGHCVAA